MQQLYATFQGMDRSTFSFFPWLSCISHIIDRSGAVSATEISSVPIAGQRLSAATAKELVKNFDLDRSGEIEFVEFAALNQFVLNLHQGFQATDRDRSGKLDASEIITALSYQQLQFTRPTIDKLLLKYSSRSSWSGSAASKTRGRRTPPTSVTFEQFLLISIHLAVPSFLDSDDITYLISEFVPFSRPKTPRTKELLRSNLVRLSICRFISLAEDLVLLTTDL